MKAFLLTTAICLSAFAGLSQADTTKAPIAPFSIMLNILMPGINVQPGHPQISAPYGYGLLYGKPRAGFAFGANISFFIREKYGIRLGGIIHSFSNFPQDEFTSYSENAHAGYAFSGPSRTTYTVNVTSLELTRRFSAGKFRFEPGVQIGRGKINPFNYGLYMKQYGTNYWKHINYEANASKMWSYGLATAIYFTRRRTDFLHVNLHLNLAFQMAFPKYMVTYSEQYYNQPKTEHTFKVRDQLYWFTAGLSANLAWKPEKYR